MQRLEVNGAVRPLKWPLRVKWLNIIQTLNNIKHSRHDKLTEFKAFFNLHVQVVFITEAFMNSPLETLRYTRAPMSLEALNLPRGGNNVPHMILRISRDVFPKAH
jgi:hypothetical protein